MRELPITDIFFDLDDTLWDFQRSFKAAFDHVFSKHALAVDKAEFLAAYESSNKKYWQLYRDKKVDQHDLHHNRFEETFDALRIPKENLETFKQDYTSYLVNTGYLLPGTSETLKYLKKWYNLHIITDGFMDIQNQKMKKAKILHYFKTVTASDEVGITKPYPDIFEEALNRGRAQKSQSIMVGDNFEFDVQGAENYGMQGIYFDPSGKKENGRKFINAIDELKNHL